MRKSINLWVLKKGSVENLHDSYFCIAAINIWIVNGALIKNKSEKMIFGVNRPYFEFEKSINGDCYIMRWSVGTVDGEKKSDPTISS